MQRTTENFANVSQELSQPQPPNHSRPTYFDIVVQIYSFSPNINLMAPFQISGTIQGRGSGFFVGPDIIMTAAHVVRMAYLENGIKFTIPSVGKDQMFIAKVRTYIPEIDIAILEVDKENTSNVIFKDRTTFFTLGDDRKLTPGDQLVVIGYPLGDTNVKITRSTYNGLQDGVIQIDSSINPGNSGGPVLYDNKVIGVVSSGYEPSMVNSVAFAIPISVFLSTLSVNSMNPIHQPFLLRLPSLGILYHNGTDNGMIYEHQDCENGVTVQWVSKFSPLYGIVKPGDRLCSITPIDSSTPSQSTPSSDSEKLNIDNMGEVKVSWYNTKIPLPHAIALLPLNGKVKVRYWDSQDKHVKDMNITLFDTAHGAFQSVYYPFDTIDYETFGGLVVMPLRSIHLTAFPFLFHKLTPMEKEKEMLVISYIIPNSIMSQSDILHKGDILKRVNNKPVNTLTEYRSALESPLVEDYKPQSPSQSPPPTPYHIKWQNNEDAIADFKLVDLMNEYETLKNSLHIPESSVYKKLKIEYTDTKST